MNLNAHILLNELEHISAYDIGENCLERNLSGYTLWQPGNVLRRDMLYLIAKGEEKALLPEGEPGAALLFMEEPGGFSGASVPWICLDGQVSADRVLLRLEEIFRKYDEWEAGLSAILAGERSIDALCRASLSIFNGPIMVHNREYELLGMAEDAGAVFPYRVLQEGTKIGRAHV